MKMKEFLDKLLTETKDATKVAIVGIGEEKLTDDGVGPYIIYRLLQYNNDKLLIINCGIDIMARMDEIITFKPSHMILIDTCTYNGPPGTVVILKRNDISDLVPVSTHTIPVQIVIDLLHEKIPNLQTFMIGIVPESLAGFDELQLFERGKYTFDELNDNPDLPFFDIKLTDTIKGVADNLVSIIEELMKKI